VAKIFFDAKLSKRNGNHVFGYGDWHRLMKGAIMDIWYTSQYVAETSEEVIILVIFESASKTSIGIFDTNVKSDLTACHSQEIQIWC
jgi:hypothetical protein